MKSIGEFAKENGINPKTLRWYDQIDLLKPEYVDEQSGHRFYGQKSELALNNIRILQEHGFSIKEIKSLSPQMVEDKIRAFEDKGRNYRNHLQFLYFLMEELRMGNDDFTKKAEKAGLINQYSLSGTYRY